MMPQINHVLKKGNRRKVSDTRRKQFEIAECFRERGVVFGYAHTSEGLNGWPYSRCDKSVKLTERHVAMPVPFERGLECPLGVRLPTKEQRRRRSDPNFRTQSLEPRFKCVPITTFDYIQTQPPERCYSCRLPPSPVNLDYAVQLNYTLGVSSSSGLRPDPRRMRGNCPAMSLGGWGWFKRVRSATPTSLGFLPLFRGLGSGQMPTGYEPAVSDAP